MIVLVALHPKAVGVNTLDGDRIPRGRPAGGVARAVIVEAPPISAAASVVVTVAVREVAQGSPVGVARTR